MEWVMIILVSAGVGAAIGIAFLVFTDWEKYDV